MRIVWKFGDGSVQFTYVDPITRKNGETEDEQTQRIIDKLNGKLLVSNLGLDRKPRSKESHEAYINSLGQGAFACFAGIIPDTEYMDKFNHLRAFREGYTWVTDAPVIDFDIVKCREIYMNDLRRIRAPLLESLDVAYQRADECGDIEEKIRIAGKKQELRDITKNPLIEEAKTPYDLIAIGIALNI